MTVMTGGVASAAAAEVYKNKKVSSGSPCQSLITCQLWDSLTLKWDNTFSAIPPLMTCWVLRKARCLLLSQTYSPAGSTLEGVKRPFGLCHYARDRRTKNRHVQHGWGQAHQLVGSVAASQLRTWDGCNDKTSSFKPLKSLKGLSVRPQTGWHCHGTSCCMRYLLEPGL